MYQRLYCCNPLFTILKIVNDTNVRTHYQNIDPTLDQLSQQPRDLNDRENKAT